MVVIPIGFPRANLIDPVHGEVGEDKLTFARDVTYWILSHSK